MKQLLLISCAVVIAACTPVPDVEQRDVSAPISATARFDALSFSGNWQIVGRFGAAPFGTLTVAENGTAGQLRVTSAEHSLISGTYRLGVPGELIPLTPGMERLIVLWVDEDFETAAIGTISGRFGAVLDRDGVLPSDRAKAARDIFEFYGWDVSALQGVTI